MTGSQEDAHDLSAQEAMESLELAKRLAQIGYKILVLSGKGGVGKSTVAANLAVALAAMGRRVGLLDVDFHGPSIPKLMGLAQRSVAIEQGSILPVDCGPHLKVMSLGLLLHSEEDAVIWRGPLKMGVIKQLLKDVQWGRLDYLIADSPPGTGDEPLSVAQLLTPPASAIVVTQPQQLSTADVRRSIRFCQRVGLPVLGVIENMSGFACPHCGTRVEVFGSGGGEQLALQVDVPFLGRIPLDPKVAESGDQGKPFVAYLQQSPIAQEFQAIVEKVLAATEKEARAEEPETDPAQTPEAPSSI
ncbi:MAG: Mrp/NBP35 family ATP-binding protein [bacterium]|jgi:Mrp family chromosome partitioning ATPase|nr:Mrp/NBP35 family ATP-binding protein [candidate division KSB1 bacterium]MDH7559898.1 Mrp/NBP35 family ATP-binding protein [bacterium]